MKTKTAIVLRAPFPTLTNPIATVYGALQLGVIRRWLLAGRVLYAQPFVSIGIGSLENASVLLTQAPSLDELRAVVSGTD